MFFISVPSCRTSKLKFTMCFPMATVFKTGILQPVPSKKTKKTRCVTSLVTWSDNGPHYHNASIILLLMHFSELCPIKLERYSFFEAQKGKMLLDSHFATFKFVLRG
jgi:hypothetical protein